MSINGVMYVNIFGFSDRQYRNAVRMNFFENLKCTKLHSTVHTVTEVRFRLRLHWKRGFQQDFVEARPLDALIGTDYRHWAASQRRGQREVEVWQLIIRVHNTQVSP
jgi:hypothetical protein